MKHVRFYASIPFSVRGKYGMACGRIREKGGRCKRKRGGTERSVPGLVECRVLKEGQDTGRLFREHLFSTCFG